MQSSIQKPPTQPSPRRTGEREWLIVPLHPTQNPNSQTGCFPAPPKRYSRRLERPGGHMQFPVYFHLFGTQLHPHLVMELLAYSAGFQLYLFLRKRWPRREAALPMEQAMWVIVGAVFGGAGGSKLLAWVESAQHYWAAREDLAVVLGGTTIVGGLLGGWIGVELVKKYLGVRTSTGDVYVFPLVLGMCVGRVGCFLTGLADHTCGVHTSLPWGVNFGDGPRHPAQLSEIAVLLITGAALLLR